MLAGINAGLRVKDKSPWNPLRSEAYLGVLVDDLTTKGVQEPYRMFTSRAEYRLSLREDNADIRLTELGRSMGLVDDIRWDFFCRKQEAVSRETSRLSSTWVSPKNLEEKDSIEVFGQALTHEYSLAELLKRPQVTYKNLVNVLDGRWGNQFEEFDLPMQNQINEQVEIGIKYQGYIDRQALEIERHSYYEKLEIPTKLDYKDVSGLSNEVRQKLTAFRPQTLGQAARISGITPAAISILLIHLKKGAGRKASVI